MLANPEAFAAAAAAAAPAASSAPAAAAAEEPAKKEEEEESDDDMVCPYLALGSSSPDRRHAGFRSVRLEAVYVNALCVCVCVFIFALTNEFYTAPTGFRSLRSLFQVKVISNAASDHPFIGPY